MEWTRARGVLRFAVVVLAIGAGGAVPGGQTPAPRLGTVSFSNGGSAAAQAPFQRGIALLHSFVYDDAAAAFREAQAADPSFALAFWFEAFTYRHPMWGSEDLAGAQRALTRLGPNRAARLEKAAAPKDRAYGEAIEKLFADAEEQRRAQDFADAMRATLARYPDDVETQAFTSLAMMAVTYRWTPPARQDAEYDRAEALAQAVFARQPNHPGAAHYIIHADDTPSRAARALPASRAYARIAPDAVHALHMPAHTFVQLGLWDEAAAATEHAWSVSRGQAAQQPQPGTALSYHDLLWLVYVNAQQGRLRAAQQHVDEGRAALAGVPMASVSPDVQYAACFVAFAYAAESGDWASWRRNVGDDPAAAGRLTETATQPRDRNMASACEFNRAVAAALQGEPAAADTLARRLRESATQLPEGNPARNVRLARAAVLSGLVARAAGRHDEAIAAFSEAARAEEDRPPLGPQSIPPLELLGAEQLAAGHAADAVRSYEAALARGKNRTAALLGLARANTKLGDRKAAAEAYRQLAGNLAHADDDLPYLAEVRRQP